MLDPTRIRTIACSVLTPARSWQRLEWHNSLSLWHTFVSRIDLGLEQKFPPARHTSIPVTQKLWMGMHAAMPFNHALCQGHPCHPLWPVRAAGIPPCCFCCCCLSLLSVTTLTLALLDCIWAALDEVESASVCIIAKKIENDL